MDIAAAEAKEQFEAVLAEVARGQAVTITDHGVPVAQVVPVIGAGVVMPPFDREKARQAAEGLIAASRGVTLGGLTIRELIEEGRD